jgi:hypothetical protein
VPFVLTQSPVFFGIDYRVFASCEFDLSKGAAVSHPAVFEQYEHADRVKPVRQEYGNFNFET